jgi:DNA-binding helix-hairpin-helix protein with protein kinase domain
MLFLGRHPFAGIFRQGTADKTVEDAIREFRFAYLPDGSLTEMEPPRSMLGLREFPASIGQLFIRAFSREGCSGQRPSAHEWIVPLESLASSLKPCRNSEAHQYYKALTACPWCTVERAFGLAVFGVKFTVTRFGTFDIVAVWAQIESVTPDEHRLTPPTSNAYLDQCRPDPSISEIRSRRRKGRLLSTSVILLAVIIVLSGVLPPLASICVLTLGIALTVKLWQFAEGLSTNFRQEYKNASRLFQEAMLEWSRLQPPPLAFHVAKKQLQADRDELANLPAMRARRFGELQAGLRQKQLTQFLERHRIEDATIPGIGQGRKTLLRCYNVEDASDVVISRLNIKGFGPLLKTALLVWRQSIEQRFVFDPAKGIDPIDIQQLDHELGQRRDALTQSLSRGSPQLRQVLLPWQVQRSSVNARLVRLAQELAQAEVNTKALGRV